MKVCLRLKNKVRFISALLLLLLPFYLEAQERVTTFGLVVKPIFPSNYFRTGPVEIDDNNVHFKLTQESGFSAGGVIRFGLTKTLSLETGINYVKRNYRQEITDTSFHGVAHFTIVGYELPIQALIFIQLSKDIWMNTSLGPSIDIFPSDVITSESYYVQSSIRTGSPDILYAGLLANIGWEWRTKNSGYFYLGSCYHRSFSDTYSTVIAYLRDPQSSIAYANAWTTLTGDYFTFDLRYYFHENPRPKKVKPVK